MAHDKKTNDDDWLGDSPSFDGFPSFFTDGHLDDKKYESLLEDLRAHDLLGPVESAGSNDTMDFATSSAFGGGSLSLFFNDAFSAVFMGDVSANAAAEASSPSKKATSGSTTPAKPPPGFLKAPPGFAPPAAESKAPPGFAPPQPDRTWTHEQQQASKMYNPQQSADAPRRPMSPGRAATPQPGAPAPGSPPKVQPQHSQGPPPAPLNAWNQAPPPHHHQQHPHPHPNGPPPPSHHHPFGPPPGHTPHMRPPPPHMFMRGPPPPAHNGGYPHGPPPPMMHMMRPGSGPPRPMSFKMMAPRDIQFVMQQQMKQIRFSDPFSDDYYFHNYMQKRNRGGMSGPPPPHAPPTAPPMGAGPPGPSGPVGRPAAPLPSWKLEHVKLVDPTDFQRAVGSRKWEAEHNVLGRNQKSSLYRPKQLLNLSGVTAPRAVPEAEEVAKDKDEKEETDATNSMDLKAVAKAIVKAEVEGAKVLKMDEQVAQQSIFANETWRRRHEIDRGMHCLLSLQDARHILDARGINVQQFHSLNENEIDPALAELRSRTTSLLLELAALLGVVVTPETQQMQCNVQQLIAMLTMLKGKRLVGRALPLLHPSARFVLLPFLAEYLLGAAQASRFSASKDASDPVIAELAEGDERLCQTLVVMLLYHPPAPPADVLTQALQRSMDGHDLTTLQLLLHNRPRAEALQALLQRGGATMQQAPPNDQVQQVWHHYQDRFVQLATTIKQNALQP